MLGDTPHPFGFFLITQVVAQPDHHDIWRRSVTISDAQADFFGLLVSNMRPDRDQAIIEQREAAAQQRLGDPACSMDDLAIVVRDAPVHAFVDDKSAAERITVPSIVVHIAQGQHRAVKAPIETYEMPWAIRKAARAETAPEQFANEQFGRIDLDDDKHLLERSALSRNRLVLLIQKISVMQSCW